MAINFDGADNLLENRKKADLSTSEGLRSYAASQGIELEEKKKKLSILQRLGRGLSALEPGNALYEAKYEGKSFAKEYIKDVFQETGSALTGREFQDDGKQKRTFKDILVKEGMKDREGKVDPVDLLGLAGDILFDPGTWFGGSIAKGIGKGVGGAAKVAVRAGEKIAPVQTKLIKEAGEAGSTAFKSFFAPESLMSKGLPDEMVDLSNQTRKFLGDAGDQWGGAFAKLPKEMQTKVSDDVAQGLINHRKKFGQTRNITLKERDKMITKELNGILANVRKENNYLKQSTHLTRETLEQINKMEADLVSNASKLRKDFGQFMSEEAVTTIGMAPAVAKTIPPQYLSLAFKAKKIDTFDAFLKSDVGREALDLEIRGELAAFGFGQGDDGLKNFYKYSKGEYKPSKLKITTKEISELDLSKQQSALYRSAAKLDEIKELDLPSYVDAIRMQQGKVDNLLDLKEAVIEKSKKNWETVTQNLVKEFDNVSPDRMFEHPETINFFVDELMPMLLKQKQNVVEKTGMKAEMLMTMYYPQIDKRVVKGFMKQGVRVGKEGGVRRMTGTMADENILKNAPEAFARRAAEVEKDALTRKMLHRWGKKYGVPLEKFADEKEALQQGYKLLKEKGSFGKEVAWIPEWDHKYISEIFDPSYQMLDNIAKATGFDAFTKMFKVGVTGLFAPFHVRNFVSGVVQNYQVMGEAALAPNNIANGISMTKKLLAGDMKGVINLGGKDFKVEGLLVPFQRRFGYSSQYMSDVGWEGGKLATKKASKLNPIYWARGLGNGIEMQQKMSVYLLSLKKGYTKKQALEFARDAGFDYSRLSPFEKHVMRRLIPFYSFSKFNLGLQAKTLAKQPARLGRITKVGRAAGTPTGLGTEEGGIQYPDWMRNKFMADFGVNQYGLPQVASGFGVAIEEQAELFEKGPMGILSRMNPLLKVPLEKTVGKDFFYNRDLKTVYNADEYAKAPKFIRDWLKLNKVEVNIYRGGEKTGETRTQYRADPQRLHIARNLFTSRGFSYLHTLFGDKELTTLGRTINSLTGMKVYEIDEQEVKYFEERDNMRDFIDVTNRLNLTGTGTYNYAKKK